MRALSAAAARRNASDDMNMAMEQWFTVFVGKMCKIWASRQQSAIKDISDTKDLGDEPLGFSSNIL